MRIALQDVFPAVMLSLLGLGILTALSVRPAPGATAYGLLIAPWAPPDAVAAVDAAIVDLRLGGRLIVLAADRPPASGSLPRGVFVIGAVAGLCGADTQEG